MSKKTTSEKLGRNSEGKFVEGNKESLGNNGGRPTEDLSVRAQVKLRIAKNPELLQTVITNLLEVLKDPSNPQFMRAVDTLVRLNGNYDPDETKITGNMNFAQRPYEGMTKEQVLAALDEIKSSKRNKS